MESVTGRRSTGRSVKLFERNEKTDEEGGEPHVHRSRGGKKYNNNKKEMSKKGESESGNGQDRTQWNGN